MTGITDIGAESAQESDSNGTNGDYESDYERFDLSGSAFGRQHPTTAVRGEAVALRKMYDEDDPDRPDVSVILDNPELVTSEPALEGSLVVESDEESDQFKVVNVDDDQTGIMVAGGKQEHVSVDGNEVTIFETEEVEVETDGDDDETETVTQVVTDEDGEPVVDQTADLSNAMGIDFAKNTFYGSIGREFTHDRIALKRGGSAGRSISSVLDTTGARSAETVEDEDGNPVLHAGGFPEHNGGLIERHPDGRDGERPRYARDTQLRPDVEGHEVVVMLQRLSEIDPDYSGPAYWATVFASLDDDRMDELAEQYAEATQDSDNPKEPEDFMAELDGDTFLNLEPTAEFEPDEDLLRETGYILWNRPDIDTLNEAREEEGFDPYEPESDDEEATAES